MNGETVEEKGTGHYQERRAGGASGVLTSVLAWISAPQSRSSLTTSLKPLSALNIKAVEPFWCKSNCSEKGALSKA